MILTSEARLEVAGRGIVFAVTLPDDAQVDKIVGYQVTIDGAAFICTGMDSSGPAEPGSKVGLVVRALRPEAKQHWCVKIKGEDSLRGVVITKVDNGWTYMKDLPGTPEVLKRGRFSERTTDIEFQTLMKAAA